MKGQRPVAFWVIVVYLGLSVVVMLTGQTMAVVNYDLAVRLGLQESLEEVGEYGVEVGRAFGAGDTVIYVPLMLVSLVGLVARRRWAVLTTTAVFGVSAYWAATILSMLVFLPGALGYNNLPGPEIWLFVGFYLLSGVVGLIYMVFRGEALLS
ncbi:MAG: MYXO-CTERM sorting domain-containing protein [Acidobacteriota bacterium]|nr:MYXO-CTERM sorting domain-containing protein [Acidobacteriota bacterium]